MEIKIYIIGKLTTFMTQTYILPTSLFKQNFEFDYLSRFKYVQLSLSLRCDVEVNNGQMVNRC